MSLRKLPEIKALDTTSGISFAPDDAVMKRWNSGVRAASEGDEGVISIYDVIGEDFWTGEGVTSKRVAGALRAIGDKDVTVNINSPGGDFFEGVAIYTLLREHRHRVTVKIVGIAASAASVIAMAGDDIRISKVGFVMVHNAWAIAVGNRHDMRAAADTLEPFDGAMAGLYAERSGAGMKAAEAWMDAETWFNGDQAVAAGLADGLLASTEMAEEQTTAARALLAERRAEMAMRRGGISGKDSKSLVAGLKGGQRDAGGHAARDAGDWMAGARQLLQSMKS